MNPIIVAMDGKDLKETIDLADSLRGLGCGFKFNDLLADRGMDLVNTFRDYGPVMADPKWYDIPETMANYGRRLVPYRPWAVTVHASASKKGVRAVVEALADTPTKVLAITVLTSFDVEACEEIYNRLLPAQVLALAEIAHDGGAHGFVCSPHEVSVLKGLYPDAEFVIPGIRSPKQAHDDQARVDTPANALRAGATRLVMGRQFTKAQNPRAEMERVLTEELGITVAQ